MILLPSDLSISSYIFLPLFLITFLIYSFLLASTKIGFWNSWLALLYRGLAACTGWTGYSKNGKSLKNERYTQCVWLSYVCLCRPGTCSSGSKDGAPTFHYWPCLNICTAHLKSSHQNTMTHLCILIIILFTAHSFSASCWMYHWSTRLELLWIGG